MLRKEALERIGEHLMTLAEFPLDHQEDQIAGWRACWIATAPNAVTYGNSILLADERAFQEAVSQLNKDFERTVQRVNQGQASGWVLVFILEKLPVPQAG